MAAVPAVADPSVSSKRAEAQQVLGQLQQLDSSLGRAVEQYNLANVKLAHIQRDIRENRYELHVAKKNLRSSERVIASRLVALYTSEQASTLEVILGARSLDDMVSRMDGAKSITSLDAQVLKQVKQFRISVKRSGRALASARVQQQQLVAERAARKHQIESQMAQQQRLLSSIKDEIARIQAQQAARQLQMAITARARLASLDRASQQQAADTVVVGISAITPAADTVVAPPPTHTGVAGVALSQLGTPYVWAGSAPGGFDCSGLVMWAWSQGGKSLPHSSQSMYGAARKIPLSAIQPGDLIFYGSPVHHVALYIGGGQIIHAPHTGSYVQVASMYYWSDLAGAGRV